MSKYLRDSPSFTSAREAAIYCLTNPEYYENQNIGGKNYFFQGNQLHDVTHANALVQLEELGYEELAKRGLRELSKQIALGGIKPPGGEKYESHEVFSPFEVSFWERDVKDEHHFKLAYAVAYLLNKFPFLNEQKIFQIVSGHWELMR